jgi:hypothetical protein
MRGCADERVSLIRNEPQMLMGHERVNLIRNELMRERWNDPHPVILDEVHSLIPDEGVNICCSSQMRPRIDERVRFIPYEPHQA